MNAVNVVPDMIADPSAFEDDAQFRLRAAQSAIRRECGWHVMPNVALTGVLNTRGGTVIRLPARHVTSIESLTDRQGNPLAYAYDPETGLVESLSGGFPVGIAAIHYAIHAGYDDAPDVQSVLISAAKRAGMSPVGLVKSQSRTVPARRMTWCRSCRRRRTSSNPTGLEDCHEPA